MNPFLSLLIALILSAVGIVYLFLGGGSLLAWIVFAMIEINMLFWIFVVAWAMVD